LAHTNFKFKDENPPITPISQALKMVGGLTDFQTKWMAFLMGFLKVLSDENQGGSKVVSIASSFFTV
jgi:hypothetical protein